jgi:hypothetical protein
MNQYKQRQVNDIANSYFVNIVCKHSLGNALRIVKRVNKMLKTEKQRRKKLND